MYLCHLCFQHKTLSDCSSPFCHTGSSQAPAALTKGVKLGLLQKQHKAGIFMHDQLPACLTIALHTSGPGQSLLRKQQEHSTGAGGSPSLLAEQPVVHPSCWDSELFRRLASFQKHCSILSGAVYRNSNPAVQSLGCITKTTPGIKSQSTHLQSRHPGEISLLLWAW